MPTVADSDCWTIAEIGVWMAWITEARNSGDMELQEREPDAWAVVEETGLNIASDEMADIEADEDTTGNNVSKLFLVCRVQHGIKWRRSIGENTVKAKRQTQQVAS